MTKRDWAIVEADRLLDHIKGAPDPIQFNVDLIATALRKAKADGMREAAEIGPQLTSWEARERQALNVVSVVIRNRADEIEGGQ